MQPDNQKTQRTREVIVVIITGVSSHICRLHFIQQLCYWVLVYRVLGPVHVAQRALYLNRDLKSKNALDLQYNISMY